MTTPNISTNPNTGIRFYSDPGPMEGKSVDLFVPLRGDVVTNSGGIHWLNLFGDPYEEPGLRFYLKGEPKRREYDPAIFYEVARWGAVDYASPKPGGPDGTWEETLTVQRRPVEELLSQVDTALLQANTQLYPANVDPMQSLLYDEAIRRRVEGTADELMNQLLIRHRALIDAGTRNMERANELRQLIRTGKEFDLSAGWTYEA